MKAMTYSVTVSGLGGYLCGVAAEIGQGLPSVNLTGLPDARLGESRDRIRAAIANSSSSARGATGWPGGRVLLSVSPPTLTAVGSVHDLALAVAVLTADDALPRRRLADTVLLGELALDGNLRPGRATLAAVRVARDAGQRAVIVPHANLAEAALVPGITVLGARDLTSVLSWLRGEETALTAPDPATVPAASGSDPIDLSDILGHYQARWALEVAAAGGHTVCLVGPPAARLTMLAERLPGLLPPLTEAEALEVTALRSLAGTLPDHSLAPITTRPYVAAHHSSSVLAVLGNPLTNRPGALARAHLGVLHLPSYPDLGNRTIEALRSALHEGEVVLPHRSGVVRFPVAGVVILTATECACEAGQDTACVCTAATKHRYHQRLRSVLAEHVDVAVRDNPLDGDRFGDDSREDSATVGRRVIAARAAAARRWHGDGYTTNAQVPPHLLADRVRLDRFVIAAIEDAMTQGRLSSHGADRTLAVAWTIADLRGADRPTANDVREALQLRHFDTP